MAEKEIILTKENYFKYLNALNVSEHTEKKMGLTYLSWPWAWGEIKKADPSATYNVYENPEGWNYFSDGRTCWVKVGVIAFGVEHVEMLPVMDNRNKSIPLDKVTSFDVNASIQRCLTKAIARHGIGLYIYAGEDLPSEVKEEAPVAAKGAKKATLKSVEVERPATEQPVEPSVTEYAKRIGTILAQMKAKDPSSLEVYKTIILDITGDASFKVKTATEEQKPLVVKIYQALLDKGYTA